MDEGSAVEPPVRLHRDQPVSYRCLSPIVIMSSVPAVPEFRDADQYRQPLVSNGVEIIRPKPRRLGDMNRQSTDVNALYRCSSREGLFGSSQLKLCNRDHVGGSAPILTKSGSREGLLSPSSAKPSTRDLQRTTPSPQMQSKNPNRDTQPKSVTVNSPGTTPVHVPQLLRDKVNGTPGQLTVPSGRESRNSKTSSREGTPSGAILACSSSGSRLNVRDAPPAFSSRTSPGLRHPVSPVKPKDATSGLTEKMESSETVQTTTNTTVTPSIQCDRRKMDAEEDEGVPPDGHSSSPRDSFSPTDCGSLSKSSSDGDALVSRKRAVSRLKSRRRNILSFPHALCGEEGKLLLRRYEHYAGSSSDENRSSGHASMSDGPSSCISSSPTYDDYGCASRGHSSRSSDIVEHASSRTGHETRTVLSRGTPLKAVPEDDRCVSLFPASSKSGRRTSQSRRGHRSRDEMLLSLEGATGLEGIRHAIEQLSVRTHSSNAGYSTSTYSSMSGSESETVRRLIHHSSLETINTNITSADEFVWLESHNRLVELQHLPWTNHDVLRVLQNGRLKDYLSRISMETVPRLAYLLQRPLVRVTREAQRFSHTFGMCTKQEISGALKVVLSASLADSCIQACHRAAAIYTVSGDLYRQSKSTRAGLQLSVGKFHRWMCDVRVGTFVHEYAAIYLTAAIENLLEELALHCLGKSEDTMLTTSVLEASIANHSDLWGVLQSFAHLNAGRTATGVLSLSRWPSSAEKMGQSGSYTQLHQIDEASRQQPSKSMEQNLLTTCVGSINELADLLGRVLQYHNRLQNGGTARQPMTWSPGALHCLYYFMRCSQLEHVNRSCPRSPVQELAYERPYLVLPPLTEWVRVAMAHAEYHRSQVVDKDDVLQAARLLLPGVDCPVKQFGNSDDWLYTRRPMEEAECARRLKVELAFRMLSCGRTDLVPHALQLLPANRVNTLNDQGLTPLMIACMRGDEAMVQILLDAGADVDVETPPNSKQHPCVNPETQHWTSLTYATIQGHLPIAKLLLEKGANVEGGARLGEDRITETPLQLAAASGRQEIVNLLLSWGAHPFLSTTCRDSFSYAGEAQRGSYSAIAVAAAHGQRTILHKLLSHPLSNSSKEMLSLEEILAEGASQLTNDRRVTRLQVIPVTVEDLNRSTASNISGSGQVLRLTRTQLRVLQEAMYHAAENGHIEITLDLRNIGIPWTLYCWMQTLAMAHELRLEHITDQLLQDFLQIWPEDCSSQFVDECLPLLFSIFRHNKNEGTSLLLADIFSTCYGKQPIKDITDVSFAGGARIDPKYVNNPEMSDVQFRVEGRVFYAHKIILVNASPCFKSMLSTRSPEGTPPIVQINDIRYDIFQLVMQYLYKGGCADFEINQNDILELMAAAHFFQLDGLLRYCEARCSKLVDLDNVVSMYIHAKIYNAVQLLEYCQGFLLKNMVALLTYDDCVRKLIFGKKLHDHDVLSGLLLTLQARIKERCQSNKSSPKS